MIDGYEHKPNVLSAHQSPLKGRPASVGCCSKHGKRLKILLKPVRLRTCRDKHFTCGCRALGPRVLPGCYRVRATRLSTRTGLMPRSSNESPQCANRIRVGESSASRMRSLKIIIGCRSSVATPCDAFCKMRDFGRNLRHWLKKRRTNIRESHG